VTSNSLDTPESIVLDGANGVTRAPREHFPDASLSLGLAMAALVAGAVLARRGPKWVVAAVLVIAALPGLAQVLMSRADAPAQRAELGRLVTQSLTEVQQHSPWPGVRFVREDDDVMFPIGRYAVPGRIVPADGGVELETRGSLLGQPCREEGSRVVCGAGP
jgi:hypothetical protein